MHTAGPPLLLVNRFRNRLSVLGVYARLNRIPIGEVRTA